MSQILILYSSVHGHTHKICDYMQQQLQLLGDQVEVHCITDAPALARFDKVLIGANIRHGKHNPAVHAYISAHQAELDAKESGFFSVSLVARKPAKNTPETNPYMQAFLRQINWKPKMLAVFGGRLQYQNYGFIDRNAIRFIMWLTKGPTDVNLDIEFTDWHKVDNFIQLIHDAPAMSTKPSVGVEK